MGPRCWINSNVSPLGTQYAKAKAHPDTFGRVFDAVQDYIKETSVFANAAADEAPSLLPKLDRLSDLWKDGLLRHGADPKDVERAAQAIFEGTLADKIYTEDELRAEFGLSDKQAGLYQEFRRAVDQSLTDVAKSEIVRIAGKEGERVVQRTLAAADVHEAAAVMNEELQRQAAELDRPLLLERAAEIERKSEQVAGLMARGYAPLMRFGKHTVTVTGPSGDVEFFGMYESLPAANRAARLLREDEAFKDATVTQGVMSAEGHRLFSGVSLDSLELFAEATGTADNEVYQAYLKLATSNRSALRRMIERKGIAGFSQDATRVLASFVTSNARMAAGNLHLAEAKKAAEAIPKEQGDLRDDAIKLVDYVTKPQEEAAAARALLFTTFIGGSVASAAVNLTQPLTMTLPFLSQFGGAVKAGRRILAAAASVAAGKHPTAVAAALQRAEAGGIVSPQEIHHLQAEAMNAIGKHPMLKKAAFLWGSLFSLSEQFNRRVSFVAAYQTALQQDIDDPFTFAEQAVIETQGLYNRGNKANWARGPVGATAMTFKQFSTHYLEFLVRMWKSGPEGKKAVGVALAMLLLAGGADGLPFADDLNDLVDTIGQALGYDLNSKRAKREFVAKALGLGDAAAEVATRGLTALPGMPIDLSLRMGMGNLLPATGLFLRSNDDTSRDLLEVAGAAGGLAKMAMTGTTKLLQGDAAGAGMAVAPVAIQNMAKALGMWETGEYRDTKGRKVMDVDAVDGAMKFLGFQPAQVARESSRIGETQRTIQLAKNVEGELAGKWAQAQADGDSEGVEAARKAIADWNEKNPSARIKVTRTQILQRVRALKSSRAERASKAAPKELRGAVGEALS
ncbi:PLxRFG domain-containing protein [Aquincola tertiaricarbonis]|uniref:PLxRFG domain-containing protein n=1 Tax=Aquincola tertiaricarbonis TaxID=391953 RepID=A0ABY4SDI5_AQUTE|nr:PLxRFG domain-containing protein [Aquincola tertiaricarbonis]URI11059.1 PLxRFG domain-containing protein [Aquincola tertiaricarbonis]